MNQSRDIIGRRCGRLVAQYPTNQKNKSGNRYRMFLCDCGNQKLISTSNAGHGVYSCGCLGLETRKKNMLDIRARGYRGAIGRKGYSPKWKGYEEISGTYFKRLGEKSSRRRQRIPVTVTIQELWEKFIVQDRRCALTGQILTFSDKSDAHNGTASVDRIDSSKSYETGNVQWIHKDINRMKLDFDQQQFIGYCHLVAKHHFSLSSELTK